MSIARSVARSIAKPIARTLTGFGGASGALESALGLWDGANYITAGNVVPNTNSDQPTSTRVTRGPRGGYFGGAGASGTLTLGSFAAPDGKLEANRFLSSGAGWYVSLFVSAPAGTYTLSVWVKSNTGASQNFKMTLWSAEQNCVATTTWQQFSLTYTSAVTITESFVLQNLAGEAVDLLFVDAEIVPGSSAPTAEVMSGHMYLNSLATVASDEISFDTMSANGLVQFSDEMTLSELTIMCLARKTSQGTGYMSMLAKVQSWTDFMAALNLGSTPRHYWNGSITTTGTTDAKGFAQFVNTGYHVITARVVGSVFQWILDGHVWREVAIAGIVNLQEMWCAGIETTGLGYSGGHFVKKMAFWDRSLADAEIEAASAEMLGVTEPAVVNLLMCEGDSLTTGISGYWYSYLDNTTAGKEVLSVNYAQGGDTIPINCDVRRPELLRAAGSVHNVIATMLMTNGAGATYMDDLLGWVTAVKAAGIKVAVGTLTPRNDATYNTQRAGYNATIRTWPGLGICDAVIDFAADPSIGNDSDALDAAKYYDGTHPTAYTIAVMETIYRPVVNGLLV